MSGRVFPAIPQSCESEQFATPDFEAKWLFRPSLSHPFVKTVRWNQASAESQSIPKRWPLMSRFRPCVDHACADRRVFRPRWNESPFHEREFTNGFLGMLANDGNGLRGSDVVARNPILLVRGAIEVFLDNLLPAGKTVASAHGEIMADEAYSSEIQGYFSVTVSSNEAQHILISKSLTQLVSVPISLG